MAKRKADGYGPRTSWYKVKNPTYPQADGRGELFERRYYPAKLKDGSLETGVEKLLGQGESDAIPIIKQLIGGANPGELGTDDRESTALYVSLQTVRVPQFRQSVERTIAELMSRITLVTAGHPTAFANLMREAYEADGNPAPDAETTEHARQFILSQKWNLKVDPLASLHQLVPLAAETMEYPLRMQWRVLEAPPSTQFVTSDAPVVRVSTERQSPLLGLGAGWATPWMEATLPLSPKACLLMSFHYPEGREQVQAAQVQEVNWRTAAFATEQIYAASQFHPSALNVPTGWDWWKPVTEALRKPVYESSEIGSGPV